MKNLIEDLQHLNSRIEDIEKAISHEQDLILQLEDRRHRLEDADEAALRPVLDQLEDNKRKLRDLEYQEREVLSRKIEVEGTYRQERIGNLQDSLASLTEKRDKLKNTIIPRMEEKTEQLRDRVTELDAEILRLNGKIRFLSEQDRS